MRLLRDVPGLAAGSEGIVVGWYVNDGTIVVSFWDGGPQRVPAESLELVTAEPAESRSQRFDA